MKQTATAGFLIRSGWNARPTAFHHCSDQHRYRNLSRKAAAGNQSLRRTRIAVIPAVSDYYLGSICTHPSVFTLCSKFYRRSPSSGIRPGPFVRLPVLRPDPGGVFLATDGLRKRFRGASPAFAAAWSRQRGCRLISSAYLPFPPMKFRPAVRHSRIDGKGGSGTETGNVNL